MAGTYDALTDDDARAAWEADTAKADPVERHRDFFLTGLLLPIWKRLNLLRPQVFRFQTDTGERNLGVKIPNKAVERVLQNLGIADGSEAKLVSGIDDHSRFVVSAKVVARATARPVCEALELAMRTHGVPDEILTDNGKVLDLAAPGVIECPLLAGPGCA